MKTFNLTYTVLSDWINANMRFVLSVANSARRKFIVANDEIKTTMQRIFPEGHINVYEVIKDGNIQLQASRGEIIVFVLQGYDDIKKSLSEKGFVEYINFMDGLPLYNLARGQLTVNELQMINGL